MFRSQSNRIHYASVILSKYSTYSVDYIKFEIPGYYI